MQQRIISASILSANWAEFGAESKNVLAAGADWLHIDVMDNHFVPNLTFGAKLCKDLREAGITAPMDVHLMVNPLHDLIENFARSGATSISIHPDTTKDLHADLQEIKNLGCRAGLVLNPDIAVEQYIEFLPQIDMLLLMSVFPGFAGQDFITTVIPKITTARQAIDNLGKDIRLQIDGGVSLRNIGELAALGIDTFVIGSAIFREPDYSAILAKLRRESA